MDLDLACVASLLALVEERHYGRAAQQLHLTTSALSKRISRLERQLGATLVLRNPGGDLALTSAGERFVAHAGPLLAQAEEAGRSVRDHAADDKGSVTLGFPSGPPQFLTQLGLADVASRVRQGYPKLHLRCRGVSFPALTSAVVTAEVDLLLTPAAVRHPAVTSIPLPARVRRVGLVSHDHELAAANDVGVADFVALPMLYNPAVPEEWMTLFYLGDVRPRRDAHLVTTSAQDAGGALRDAARGPHVAVAPEFFADLLRPYLQPLALRGAPEIALHVAHRRSERRGAVHALVAALQALPARCLRPR